MPRVRIGPTAVRLSTTCARATSPGSRIAVRLTATVQASRSRAWSSIAARAAGARSRPSSRSPASRAWPYSGGSSGRPSTRVGSGSRAGWMGTPPVVHVPVPCGATPGVGIVSHRGSSSVFRHPSGSRSGFPVPLADRVTLLDPSADAGRYGAARPGRQRGYPPTAPGIHDSWITRRATPSGRSRGPGARASGGRRR